MTNLEPTVIVFKVGEFRVEYRGNALWAIKDGPAVLNSDNEWEYESLPSSSSNEFLQRSRFPLDEAIRRAQEIQK